MRIFVNDEFMSYLGTFFGAMAGDENWCPEFDVNGDGTIDIADIAWFARAYGTWIEIGGPNILLSAAIGGAGILLGYALAKVL